MSDAKNLVDAWMTQHADRVREHMRRGMTKDQAEIESKGGADA